MNKPRLPLGLKKVTVPNPDQYFSRVDFRDRCFSRGIHGHDLIFNIKKIPLVSFATLLKSHLNYYVYACLISLVVLLRISAVLSILSINRFVSQCTHSEWVRRLPDKLCVNMRLAERTGTPYGGHLQH